RDPRTGRCARGSPTSLCSGRLRALRRIGHPPTDCETLSRPPVSPLKTPQQEHIGASMAKPGRPGAAKGKKGAPKGTGGKNKRGLAGRGPTPKAEDRTYHKAYKQKQLAERAAAKRPQRAAAPRRRPNDDNEYVTGRNSVLEALRTKIPATAFYIAHRVEMDDRVKEMIAL